MLTGKGLELGGSLIRTKATGYGTVYFLQNMLTRMGDSVKGKSAVIFGSGKVSTHAAQKLVQLGGKVLTMSDSDDARGSCRATSRCRAQPTTS